MIEVVRATEERIPSFRETLHFVASERQYLAMVEAPPFEKVYAFQMRLISEGAPAFYAVDGDRVVGWCDIVPIPQPRMGHRGTLGMGLLPTYRGRGLGSLLMQRSLAAAKEFGLAKVELSVYRTNVAALRLYEKFGFEHEGCIRGFMIESSEYVDLLNMGKFLGG